MLRKYEEKSVERVRQEFREKRRRDPSLNSQKSRPKRISGALVSDHERPCRES